MGIRIQQLPPHIANQIAAGEVIERPASVVKELLENALDAGATTILVEIGYGGLNQIKISDNGMGIVAEDLPLALSAHATSKINTLDDLYAIESMGFRGEALASIASVAKVTISSKPQDQECAMRLEVKGQDMTLIPCARMMGTTVDVLDLFFNAPVRKRFLKSEKLEFQAIEMVTKRFVLSAPHVALTLKHNGKELFALPAATSEHSEFKRIARIMGGSFVKSSIYLEVAHGGMKLRGWLSGFEFQRSQNDKLWVYLNQRMVKDKLIYQALKQAYEGILHTGRFPSCVLYLTMNHAEVDVNVHPTKHEVRFQQPRLVFDFLVSQISAALGSQSQKTASNTQELHEPHPEEFRGYRNKEKALSSLNKPPKMSESMPWVVLNNQYILVFLNQEPYIVDVIALQHHGLKEYLSQFDLPLASRPLLVPLRYSFLKDCPYPREELIACFSQLGLDCEGLEEQGVLIHSIPLCIPYLDVRRFLDAVGTLERIHPVQVIELMIQSQVFDPRLFSFEEQMELNELLLKIYKQEYRKPGLFNLLRMEDCRNLLHV